MESPTSYTALLELEKGSHGSPKDHLKEAARIIGVDLDSYPRGEEPYFSSSIAVQVTAAPKEEWVLRWLMKKLKAPLSEVNSSYTVEESSWILFRILLGRIPPRTLATILTENKFLNVLQSSLEEIEALISRSSGPITQHGVSKSSSGSRKRKRTETPAESGAPPVSSCPSNSLVYTFLSVASTVKRLVVLADSIRQATLKAQVQLILRGEPKIAADLLRRALRCAASVDEVLRNNHELDAVDGFFKDMLAIIEIWKLRSDGDGNAKLNNGVFASKALEPALRFFAATLNDTNHSEARKSFIQGIERLIVVHVVLPLRSIFFASVSKGSAQAGKAILPRQVKVISDELVSQLHPDSIEAMCGIFPLFLDIAIRALPRDTFKRQVNEAPWLETLFATLSTQAGYSLSADKRLESQTSFVLLQDLLQVVIDRNLTLSLDTLIQYTVRFSGLHKDYPAEPQWALVSQIIQIGVDVFLPNSGLDESKYLLESLISQVTLLCQQPGGFPNGVYALVKDGIILPLLNGFFGARDSDTLLRIWNEQLRLLDSARSNDKTIPPFSIWEDDDFSKSYGTLVASSVSTPHINSQIDKIVSTLSHPGHSSEIYASLVFLDSILLPKQGKKGESLRALYRQTIFDTVETLIPLSSGSYWRWRLWRILGSSVHVAGISDQNVSRTVTTSILPTAKRIFESFDLKIGDSSDIGRCQEAFWCFKFVVSLAGELNDDLLSDYLDKLVPTIVSLLENIPDPRAVVWDGRVEGITSPPVIASGCLSTFLAKGQALALLSTDLRRRLLTTLLATVMKATGSRQKSLENQLVRSGNSGIQLADLWSGFVSREFLLASPNVVYDLTFVLFEHLKKAGSNCDTIARYLLNIPVRLIPRLQRGNLLDLLEEIILQKKLPSDVELDILTLMTRLVDAPKSPANITSNDQALWKLAGSISVGNSDSDLQLFQAVKQLHKAVIDKVLISSEGNLGKYGQKVYSAIREPKKTMKSVDFETMEYYVFVLSLHLLHTHRSELDEKKRERIELLRKEILTQVLSELKSLSRKLKKHPEEVELKPLTGIFAVADTLQDLLQGNKDALGILRKLEQYATASDCDGVVQRFVKRRMLAWKATRPQICTTLLEQSSLVSVQRLQESDEKLTVYEIYSQLSTLSKDALIGFLRDTRSSGFLGDQAAYRLLLVGIALGLLDPIDDRESPASLELTSTFTDATEALLLCTSIEPFCLAAECLDILLRTQPRSISQWNVDNLLAKVAVVVSPSGPKIPSEYAGTIFARLCRLLGILFGLYRKKLSGRFHLILPTLQRMLRCLFASDSRATKSLTLAATHPTWIGSGSGTPLQPEHAAQYTRLLTSLCDPTVSAVENQRGGQSQGLTDNTKKVKSLAGQHLQYLIMEYVGAQLRGHLAPEIKAALMQGFYAVLDVMSKNTMKAMNAAMDSSARAVFKGLYDDYVKFGKWNHD
ncbi:nucleolar pre-ribosomal-associated protein 2 [Coccidioides immitis RS]|uniref:Nucleolar pre-ribosomal-associated protein 2 n=3 Tax=Coccidioides immitis TaxID=5501 RepID=J3K731_COCIM|nr:nucleolar pre-ribosomal-associated protein 2 [Coccidioides immitis RS]EAS30449.3 nucleolar pre-ribosomal-associated protein 2 [Coccidioides immitis RS]KMP02999.1 hypothetical protein CIRG_02691 [Coccidioides immitis RMSCC 2394]